jgi:hypothetical protein
MMRIILQAISALALVSTLMPAVLFMTGSLELPQVMTAMLVATVVWFIATPLWMGKPSELPQQEVVP